MSTPFNETSPGETKAEPQRTRNVNGKVSVNRHRRYTVPVTTKNPLTDKQTMMLIWMARDNFVEACTHKTTRETFTTGLQTYSGSYNHRTVKRLKELGYVNEEETFYFGVKWFRYTINKEGTLLAEWLRSRLDANSPSR